MRYVGPRSIVRDDRPAPVPFWTPPVDLFLGQTVVIVGGGPSIASIDLELLRGHSFIAINSACRRLAPIATEQDWLYFHDNNWEETYTDLARAWPGPVVSPNINVKARRGEGVNRLDLQWLTEAMGVLPDHSQPSSGHSAACAAALLGARRIVLIGFECRFIDGRSHGHGDYSMNAETAFRESFLPAWRALAPRFAAMGVEIINATPRSAIAEFRFMPLRDALVDDGIFTGPVVASFYAPRFDKWGCNYDDLLRLLDASCRRLALRHVVISDQPRPGLETALFDLPENLMQALIDGQRQFLEAATGPVLFVGADSLLTRDPFEIGLDHDLAITLGPFADCAMNNGFILARRTGRCAEIWRAALDRRPIDWGDDQRAQFAAIRASTLRVAELRCEDHNWAPDSLDDGCRPTVVHFRGERKKWMKAWAGRHLAMP